MEYHQLLVGDVIEGHFGNCILSENTDDRPKRVEGVGADWVVVRTEEGEVLLITRMVGDLHESLWENCYRNG